MSDYLGPAGIFSTDNPVSDEMQILAEQGPEDELWEEEYPVEDIIHGICHRCSFWEWEFYWTGDLRDLEDAKEKLNKRHRAERPGCPGILDFG